jgi:hypothetical protein
MLLQRDSCKYSVLLGRQSTVPSNLEKVFITDDFRIELDLDNLGMIGAPR